MHEVSAANIIQDFFYTNFYILAIKVKFMINKPRVIIGNNEQNLDIYSKVKSYIFITSDLIYHSLNYNL